MFRIVQQMVGKEIGGGGTISPGIFSNEINKFIKTRTREETLPHFQKLREKYLGENPLRLDTIAEDVFNGGNYLVAEEIHTEEYNPWPMGPASMTMPVDKGPIILESENNKWPGSYRGVLELDLSKPIPKPKELTIRKVGDINDRGLEPIYRLMDMKIDEKRGYVIYISGRDVTTGKGIGTGKYKYKSNKEVLDGLRGLL